MFSTVFVLVVVEVAVVSSVLYFEVVVTAVKRRVAVDMAKENAYYMYSILNFAIQEIMCVIIYIGLGFLWTPAGNNVSLSI